METQVKKEKLRPVKPLYIRKFTKSGSTRYLSIGTIIPYEWENVKVTVEEMSRDGCVLRLEPIT